MRTGTIADRLATMARARPDQPAVVTPGTRSGGERRYHIRTFGELNQDVDDLAAGLRCLGLVSGNRIALMVRPGEEFIALAFALLRAGGVAVLIDPGMGRRQILGCLDDIQPDGYAAIPLVQAIRCLRRRKPAFGAARLNICVGRWFPGAGTTFRKLLKKGRANRGTLLPAVQPPDPAAIIFTSGSTGPPKGVHYEHGMFDAQARLIQTMYGISSGEVDLPGFPLFGLFNAALGVTTVVPEMDPTRPADVDPERILEAVRDQQVTQIFGSPAFWNRVGRYGELGQIELPTVRRALSAGGPVPNHVLERVGRMLSREGADLFTPYGATESLPVASLGGLELLRDMAPRTRLGAGTCVGRAFPQTEIRIIEIGDGPISQIADAPALPPGEIGEIIVRGPSVTREYFRNPHATRCAKIVDPRPLPGEDRPAVWHRMGDVGYLDDAGLLWFCGRKADIVETDRGRMFSVCCEAIFENHPRVYRAALIGLGLRTRQIPVVIVEPEPGEFPSQAGTRSRFRDELLQLGRSSPLTAQIQRVLFHPGLPVDTRHNVKIQRSELARWAAAQPSAGPAP